ncbi:DNA alkylation repair protein [Candidatus Protochlamydia phocaeensis]|uniref:DNA alkylation repair protein n=1 Tax=Candidatus Protochlamydia phocaeensis TaxID=1414722 RepID=UPI0008397554|nr:DNA alkylation repair protein [Candidatus Protochlamydia phocaeensis]
MQHGLFVEVQKSFQAAANPVRANKQQAYMRNLFPFFGLQTEARRALQKDVFSSFALSSEQEIEPLLRLLWNQREREYQYCAIDLAKYHIKKLSLLSLPLLQELIKQKSWWDTVDDLAVNLVGKLVGSELQLMDKWISDPDLWIRRTALICQLKRKSATDSHRLFEYCLQRAHEEDFFIRKAIGWALREYSKTNPLAVKNFIALNQSVLSGLSIREASKYV